MPNIIVKKVETEEERKLVADLTFYAFSASPGSQDNQLKRREYFKSAREFLVFEDSKPMSTSNFVPMTQNIRGKVFDMGGVAGVASYPEARRKGFIKLLMKKMFDEMRAENRPVSILYPFRESFYSKFGYFVTEQESTGIFSPSNLKSIMNLDLGLELKRESFSECVDQIYRFNFEVQKKWHGYAVFEKTWVKSGEMNPPWVVFAYEGDKILGLMLYRISGFEGTMKISDFLYLNSNAKYSLLQWIGRHVDHITQVELNLNPNYNLETWIDDLKIEKKAREWVPSHMFRVISVENLSGMDVNQGSINIEVLDPHCPWNNGVWNFLSENGKLVVNRTNKETNNKLTINGLSAIIYGVYDLDDFYIRGWGDLDHDGEKMVETIFPKLRPFISKFV